MNHDVCAVLKRTKQIRSSERRVDNNRNALCMCDVCNRLNVDQVTIRIAQRLKEHSLGVFINGILEVLNVIRIYELGGHAVLR